MAKLHFIVVLGNGRKAHVNNIQIGLALLQLLQSRNREQKEKQQQNKGNLLSSWQLLLPAQHDPNAEFSWPSDEWSNIV